MYFPMTAINACREALRYAAHQISTSNGDIGIFFEGTDAGPQEQLDMLGFIEDLYTELGTLGNDCTIVTGDTESEDFYYGSDAALEDGYDAHGPRG